MNRLRLYWALGLMVALVVAGTLWLGRSRTRENRTSGTEGTEAKPSHSSTALGVEDFMRNVDKYPGERKVEGVVSSIPGKDGLLTLIDTQELEKCGVVTCSSLSLPVRWEGVAPALRDVVRVSGHVEKDGEKLLFVALALEQVPRPVAGTP